MNDTRKHSSTGTIAGRLGGLLLCLGGLLLDAGAVGGLLDADGTIEGQGKLVAILVGRAGLISVGLYLLARGSRPLLTAPALIIGLAAAGAGVVARLGDGGQPASPTDGFLAERPPILPLDEICEWVSREDPYGGTDNIIKYQGALQEALEHPGAPIRIAIAREELADMLLRHGKNGEAIGQLELALATLLEAGAEPDSVNRVRRALGVAQMRAGEMAHCIEMHNPERCLFPIEGSGVWPEVGGARAAIRYFEQYLAERPHDLDVRWLLNIAYMAAGDYPGGVPPRWLIARDHIEVADPGVARFEDVAASAGVATLSTSGSGILDDFDGDGFLDLFVSSMDHCQSVRYYHSRGDGTFEDWTERGALSDQLGGFNCVQADYDNDGRLDVYVLRGGWQGRIYGRQLNTLLRQRKDGTFEDVTLAAGLGQEAYPTQVAGWADFDLDGDVDLYVANEYFPGQLFRNEGDGRFTDVAASAGVVNENEKGRYRCAKGATWGDYDNDGDPDLFVSNYGEPNRLYRNEGDGTFVDVAPVFGLDLEAYELSPGAGPKLGMTSALGKDLTSARRKDVTFATWWWDFDNDGWLDLYVGGFGAGLEDVVADYLGEPSNENRRLRLYRNLQGEGFENVAERMGVDRVRLPMGANYGDVDNDGWLDFYLGTGRPPFEYLMPNVLYRSVRGERFIDVTTAAGVGHLQKGHGVSFGDVDNDGDQDIFAQMGGSYAADAFHDALFANPGTDNRWITVVLRGVRSNRSAIGTRLKVVVDTPAGRREIHALAGSGGSFGCSSLQQEIGLGNATHIASLTVAWPASGTVQEFDHVPLDAFVGVDEGAEQLRVLERTSFQLH